MSEHAASGAGAADIPAGLDPETAVEPSVSDLERARSKGRVRGLVAVLGPAFVASVAYVDPGNFASNIASLVTFILGGTVLWSIAIPLAIANAAGAWVGSTVAIRQGARFVRWAFLLAALAIAGRMLWFVVTGE